MDARTCAYDNLILKFSRFEEEHPYTTYTGVYNIHNILTFERYFVSEVGTELYPYSNRNVMQPKGNKCAFYSMEQRYYISLASSVASIAESGSKENESIKQAKGAEVSQEVRSTLRRLAVATDCIKHEIDASKASPAGDQEEWNAIRHPRLPASTSSRYFVNKDSALCSKAKNGEFRRLKLRKHSHASYGLQIDKKTTNTLKVVEIMAYTFSEHFDSSKHCIFHKDGDRENCN
ncbi:hypothetical protein BJV82DRAFT_581271 [Fennellomyces sp. T-0311]|nr:hypothetical protein BJV82DRAFT_581271 [Fennellomyces sp. T-0311]